MKREKILLETCIIAMLLLINTAISQNDSVVVNMMLDLELCPTYELTYLDAGSKTTTSVSLPSEKKISLEWNSRTRMLNEVQPKGLNITLFLTGDYLEEKVGDYSYNLPIASLANLPNYEIALHGMTTDETLGNMSYRDQDFRISESRLSIENAHLCDVKDRKAVKGFRPQSFSQNNDTYQILDSRNFSYDAGYQVGKIYLPGHENDTKPYRVDGHLFYAVPVSTHQFEGELIPMEDRFALENNLTGIQWGKLLIEEYEECAGEGAPMVVIFHNFVSGYKEDYFNAYKEFVNYSTSRNAMFVTTQQLVDMHKS